MNRGIYWSLLFLVVLFFPVSTQSCSKQKQGSVSQNEQAGAFTFSQKPSGGITFLSTQLNSVEESWKMRNIILKDFPGNVDFRPNDNAFLIDLLSSELKKKTSSSILIGALHGDLTSLDEQNALQPLDTLYSTLKTRGFAKDFIDLSRFNGKDIFYIPWMQASFVMVANKKALPYLPKGADLNSLTYDQLYDWAKNIYEKTNKKMLGFPVGEKGLMHRFFQGYLYPSYTGSTLLKFKSPDAVKMWEYFKKLWMYVQPSSLVYSAMSDPLLIDDVWIAWDHTARLVKALMERPDDFVVFPAPIGPKGRGFMAVISGLSIPKNQTDSKDAAMLIDYLTAPAIQERTLMETGFFPVIDSATSRGIPLYLKNLNKTVNDQLKSKQSILTLMPIGLGQETNDYNNYFMLTFSGIVLENRVVMDVLRENAAKMQLILDKENAKCWLPDISDSRPCKIE